MGNIITGVLAIFIGLGAIMTFLAFVGIVFQALFDWYERHS